MLHRERGDNTEFLDRGLVHGVFVYDFLVLNNVYNSQ